jgi:pimeloyl-ACP methyl ester carboxylesterase
MVDDVVAVLDAYSIDRCVLAGESMGGTIALLAAERHPQRVDGLVLVAPAPPIFDERRAALAAGCRADYAATTHAFVERCVPEPDSEHIRRWGRDILRRAEPEQAARLLEMWRDVEPGDPTSVRTRTLLVQGTEDVIAPPAHAQELARLLPDAELLLLDGTGHVPTMTRPDDVAGAIVERFPL